ncbi:hypothetical protein BC938DRAFT_477864 [Jimgerdemannia flammicorona]|uniref:Phospholipid/glycerol acyltransferase domain-containing protein n=1 Tax=Jimgerdemannia flammicorona TaxID=994334 RepID=A0A433QNQ8_9FUNG|nr:hypothetical protein BC938DRAFT_477864 [Jimgerdemannia flammicorona]
MCNVVLNIFFSKIRWDGAHRILVEGPIIFIAAPHSNQLYVSNSILLPKGLSSAVVTLVVLDMELLIKKEFKKLRAIELLTSEEGCPFKCLPDVNQESIYRSVHKTLNEGNCIAIFSDGSFHDHTEMLPLKAGVTVMVLGAMHAHLGLDVKIVPCRLNYFHPHKFHSCAMFEFGMLITISLELVEKFKNSRAEKHEVCGKLLDTNYNALKSITVRVLDYKTLMVVELDWHFVYGYDKYKKDPRVMEL